MGLHVPIPRRRARRALAVIAVAASLLSTAVYWLATLGVVTPTIAAPPGLTNGEVADVTAMSSAVTRSNGGASLQTGVAIAKLKIAKDFTHRVRVVIAWTNAVDAAKVLRNPNAQISLGLYRPIKTTTGSCSPGEVKVSDGGTDFCAVLDTAARGSATVSTSGSSEGTLLLAKNIVTGFIEPTIDGSGTLSTCSTSTTSWCQPASGVGADQRVLYVIASILTPGGVPQGQQTQAGSLSFFIRVRRTA
ncbi:MAG: hypothetical protein IRZ04_20225 [Rhodospirillales bacterium]|nr:hypothetical protein [Rhodospirillales bacterium]